MKLKKVIKWSGITILVVLVLAGIAIFVAYWRSTNECGRAFHGELMKAVVYCEYGVANLRVEDVEKPMPADDQILIRVRAASLNPLDGHFVRGMLLARLMGGGLRKPKQTRLGVDYAGIVEAVGKNVTQFKTRSEE